MPTVSTSMSEPLTSTPTQKIKAKTGTITNINPAANTHVLQVTIVRAVGLKATNFFSSNTSDAYVSISLLGNEQECKTDVDFGTCDPNWNETKQFYLPSANKDDATEFESIESNVLLVSVFGRHKVKSDTFIGKCVIPISTIISADELYKTTARVNNNSTSTQNAQQTDANGDQQSSLYSFNLLEEQKREEKEIWFKLMPQSFNKKHFAQTPGKILLRFSYNYINAPVTYAQRNTDALNFQQQPVVQQGVQQTIVSPENTSSNSSTQESEIITNNPNTSNPPNGLVLHYKCPYCLNVYPPEKINTHMSSCAQTADIHAPSSSPPQQPFYNNNNMQGNNNNMPQSPPSNVMTHLPPPYETSSDQQQRLQQYYSQQYSQQGGENSGV